MPKGTFSVSTEFAEKHGVEAREEMMIATRTTIAVVCGKKSIDGITLAEPTPGGGSGMPHVLIEMDEMGPKYAPLFQELPVAIVCALFVDAQIFSGLPDDRVPVDVSVKFRGVGKHGVRFDRSGLVIPDSRYIDPMLVALGTGLELRDRYLLKPENRSY